MTTWEMTDRTYIKLVRNIVSGYHTLADFTNKEIQQFGKVFPGWATNKEFSEFAMNVKQKWNNKGETK